MATIYLDHHEYFERAQSYLCDELIDVLQMYVVEKHLDTFANLFSEALIAGGDNAQKLADKHNLHEVHALAYLDEKKELNELLYDYTRNNY